MSDSAFSAESLSRKNIWMRLGAHIVIIGYLYVAMFWLLPDSPFRTAMLSPIRQTVANIAMDQNWQMFAPKMRKTAVVLDAKITYDDGLVKVWKFPRVNEFSVAERLIKERYRKFGYDHVNWDQEKYLWPDLVRYVARVNQRPGHSVSTVELVRHFRDLQSPREAFGQFTPESTYSFYTHNFAGGVAQ